jgi:hypothetical protein
MEEIQMTLESIPQVIDEYAAAKILSKSVQSLRNERYLRKGAPYIKIGRSVRYVVTDLVDFLNRHRIDPEHLQVTGKADNA